MKRRGGRRTYSVIGAILLAGTAQAARSQNRSTSQDNELLLLGGAQTVVTASKRTQRAGDAPSAVTVITEDDIRASGAPTLIDLLRSVPGVDVSEPNRTVANVSVRGFNGSFANKLLVMVDGRSIFEHFFGGVIWRFEPILLTRIKRIEIVRGPGSALYGANAFNGVINIITKTPQELAGEKTRVTARTLQGEQNTGLSETLVSGGSAAGFSFSLGASYDHSNGFGDGTIPNPVRDHFNKTTLTADAQQKIGRRAALRLNAGNAESGGDYYEGGFRVPALRFHIGYVNLEYLENQTVAPVYARFFVNNRGIVSNGQTLMDTRTYDGEIQQTRTLSARHNLVYGGSYRHIQDKGALTGTASHSQDLFALYAQDEWRLTAKTRLFIGARVDSNSQYGTNFSPRLSLVRQLGGQQSLRASYGTAFRAPTLSDAFIQTELPVGPNIQAQLQGNADLQPEKVTNLEIGYRKELRGGHLGLNAFYNRVSDRIMTLPTAFFPAPFPAGIPSQFGYTNQGTAYAAGLEAEAEFRVVRGVRGLVNYAYQNVESGRQPFDLTPPHKFNFAIQTDPKPGLEGYLAMHYVDATRYHDGINSSRTDSYLRFDARLGYRFGRPERGLAVALVATNLFDTPHYEYPAVSILGQGLISAPQRRTLYLTFDGKF